MTVSASRAFGDAWHRLRAAPHGALGASAILFLAIAALNTFDLLLAPLDPPRVDRLITYFVVALPWSLLVLVPLAAGLDLLALRHMRGGAVRAADVVDGYRRGGRIIAAYLLLSLTLMAGYLLFVIPGIILSMSLLFVPLYVLDQDMTVRQAFRASMLATRGHMGTLFVFLVTGMAIAVVGTALLLVGLIPAMAWLFLARAELYRQARGEHALTAPQIR